MILFYFVYFIYSYDVVICCYTLDVVSIIFYFILFILLYPDVMDNYVLRSYDIINFLCFGRQNIQNLFLLY